VNLSLQRDLAVLKKKTEDMEREGRRRKRMVTSDSSPSPSRRRRLSSSVSTDSKDRECTAYTSRFPTFPAAIPGGAGWEGSAGKSKKGKGAAGPVQTGTPAPEAPAMRAEISPPPLAAPVEDALLSGILQKVGKLVEPPTRAPR